MLSAEKVGRRKGKRINNDMPEKSRPSKGKIVKRKKRGIWVRLHQGGGYLLVLDEWLLERGVIGVR